VRKNHFFLFAIIPLANFAKTNNKIIYTPFNTANKLWAKVLDKSAIIKCEGENYGSEN